MNLTWLEKRWLHAIFEGFAPPTDADAADPALLSPRPGEVDYVGGFLEANEHASPIAKLGMRVACVLVGTSPVWTGTAAKSIDRLPPEERAELLAELAEHPLGLVRELTWLMKVQTSMTLFSTSSVRARSGYDREREAKTPVRLRIVKGGQSKKEVA